MMKYCVPHKLLKGKHGPTKENAGDSGTCSLGRAIHSKLFINWNSLFYIQVEILLYAKHFTESASFSPAYIQPIVHHLPEAL
jgi:hypothetical protein